MLTEAEVLQATDLFVLREERPSGTFYWTGRPGYRSDYATEASGTQDPDEAKTFQTEEAARIEQIGEWSSSKRQALKNTEIVPARLVPAGDERGVKR
jgi:hypothetical protein